MATCDMIRSFDDADFGFWDTERMGEPKIHSERCGEPATTVVTDRLDGAVYHFCTDCAKYGA